MLPIKMVEAGGVGTFTLVENTQLIEKSTRSKRSGLRKRAQLERIWNVEFRSTLPNMSLSPKTPGYSFCLRFAILGGP